MAFTFGHISGGHFNCAISFSFVFSGRISPMRGFFYFLAQFFGGLLGAFLLKLFVPMKFIGSCYGATLVSPALSYNQAFFMEFCLTFFLLFAVSAATDSQKNEKQIILTPLVIGFCVFCANMTGVPFTGCSMSPTRSFSSLAASYDVIGLNIFISYL